MFIGIEVYEILENGNLLNGVYTNKGLLVNGRYAVDNEIARKTIPDTLGVVGLYDCRYIETILDPNVVTSCILQISKVDDVVYQFEWTENGPGTTPYFQGLGLMVGNNHIAVSYT